MWAWFTNMINRNCVLNMKLTCWIHSSILLSGLEGENVITGISGMKDWRFSKCIYCVFRVFDMVNIHRRRRIFGQKMKIRNSMLMSLPGGVSFKKVAGKERQCLRLSVGMKINTKYLIFDPRSNKISNKISNNDVRYWRCKKGSETRPSEISNRWKFPVKTYMSRKQRCPAF